MSVAAVITTTTLKPQKNIQRDNAESVQLLKKIKNPSDLQLKLEQQLEKSRQVKAEIHKGNKDIYKQYVVQEKRPLVSQSNSEDDFEDINIANDGDDDDDDELVVFKQPARKQPARKAKLYSGYPSQCTDQLLKDGFRLDELSDDEDLDLIPPRPTGSTWCACENLSCTIQ